MQRGKFAAQLIMQIYVVYETRNRVQNLLNFTQTTSTFWIALLQLLIKKSAKKRELLKREPRKNDNNGHNGEITLTKSPMQCLSVPLCQWQAFFCRRTIYIFINISFLCHHICFLSLVLEFLWWQIRWRRAERKERLQKNPWSLEMTQISEKEKVFAKKIEGKAKTNMNMVELWEPLEKHFYIYINIKHSKKC